MSSRFESRMYQSVLQRFDPAKRAGVSYSDRLALLPVMRQEPVLWGWKPLFFLYSLLILTAIFLLLAIADGFFHAPLGLLPLYPLTGLAFLGTAFPLSRIFRRTVGLWWRRPLSMEDFISSLGPAAGHGEITVTVRAALGRAYRLRPELIYAADTEKSLRPFSFTLAPFAFEIAVGAPLLMGKDYLAEDPRVDEVILRLNSEPRTVADIVRIMDEAYGGQLRTSGGIGSPISDGAQQRSGPADCGAGDFS